MVADIHNEAAAGGAIPEIPTDMDTDKFPHRQLALQTHLVNVDTNSSALRFFFLSTRVDFPRREYSYLATRQFQSATDGKFAISDAGVVCCGLPSFWGSALYGAEARSLKKRRRTLSATLVASEISSKV